MAEIFTLADEAVKAKQASKPVDSAASEPSE
jgi:hypothetical protein